MVAHSPVGAQASYEFPISAVGTSSIGSLALGAPLGPPAYVPFQLKTLFKSGEIPVGAPLLIDRQVSVLKHRHLGNLLALLRQRLVEHLRRRNHKRIVIYAVVRTACAWDRVDVRLTRDSVGGAVGEEEEVTNGVLRQVQPQGWRNGDVVVDPWAALIIKDIGVGEGDGEVVVVDVRHVVVVVVACVAAAAAELHDGILVVHTVDDQPRVAAGGVVAQHICRLIGKIERVSDIHFAACVWLQRAYGGAVIVAMGSSKQDGKEKRQRQPVAA